VLAWFSPGNQGISKCRLPLFLMVTHHRRGYKR
jgi:hypothetical protein